MRKFLIFLTLVMAACGGNGDGVNVSPEPVQHAPQISNLTLSPDNALYMEGDGSVQVTAEFAFTDLGRDLETLQVEMSDGTSLVIPIPDTVNTASGTLAQAFDVTTADANGCTVEIWLVDSAGQSSNHLSAAFSVIPHTPEISSVTLSTSSILHMDGGGNVVVAAEVAYRDIGRDIKSLWVRMPDGRTVESDKSIATETGTFTEDLMMSTAAAGTFTVEFWLVDETGQSSNHVTADFSVLPHPPEILDVALSTNSALHMDGDGSVVVTAEVTYRDIGRDVQSLWVRMPDGTSVQFDQSFDTETGTFTEDFMMSTETIGGFAVEFWLVDAAGDSSDPVTAQFHVVADIQVNDWTNRLRVPLPLLDVVWDGQVFIAVGYGGTVLTSVDGIDWVTQESSTDDNIWDDALYAVAAFGSDIYAVGGSGVLLSTDHGETWTVKARPSWMGTAVTANSSQIVVTGLVGDLGFPRCMISEDRGDTWQEIDFSWGVSDLVYRDGLFVAPLWTSRSGTAGVIVSTDGRLWNEIVVLDAYARLDTVVHDDSQFFVAGANGKVFSSFDAFNWTELATPLEDVDYLGAAWNGTQLMLAGKVPWYLQDGTYRPIGISSSDGGASWDIFGIDTNFESYGIAWGNGRFVSVGRLVLSDEGAIYTND